VKGLLDPLDHQNLALSLYLTNGVGVEAVFVEGNLTRRQRAGKGAEQSAAGRRYQIIQRRRVRLLLIGRDAVVLCHLAVDPEEHRLLLARYQCPPDLSLHQLYLHP
jgi:hypothetical protein